MATDKKAGGFWLASGDYDYRSGNLPLADLGLNDYCGGRGNDGVGWFVL